VIRWSFGVVIRILEVGGVMRVEQRNADLLAASRGKPVLVLANHPCYLDILVLLALIPDALCVVKSGVWWNPFYGGVVRAAGYLSNDDPSSWSRPAPKRCAPARRSSSSPRARAPRPARLCTSCVARRASR
jgi:1-acyl-sn-glycerol-3-phosphate acyltransferase